MKSKKKFDCVALQHEGALRIYEATKGMTVKEQVAWWNNKAAARNSATKTAKKSRRSRKATAR